jgi:hypothetical protein
MTTVWPNAAASARMSRHHAISTIPAGSLLGLPALRVAAQASRVATSVTIENLDAYGAGTFTRSTPAPS